MTTDTQKELTADKPLTAAQKRYKAKKHQAEQDRLIAAGIEKNKARLKASDKIDWNEYKYRGFTIRIIQDDNCENPREAWDEASKMVCWHRRYTLGDKHQFLDPEEFREWIKQVPGSIVMDLYLYDHSGISISARSFIGRAQHAEWDSGQVGYVYMTPDMIRENFCTERITKAIRERAIGLIENEVKVYDDYLRGYVYGYKVEEADGEEIDSVWGYYGDPDESGLLEAAWDTIDYQIKEYAGKYAEEKAGFFRHKKIEIKNRIPLSKRKSFSLWVYENFNVNTLIEAGITEIEAEEEAE